MAPLEIPHDLIGQSSLYNHPDPLLRRLRLDDSSGGSITDLDKAFKGKEVVVLYAGSEHGSNNLKSFHRDLTRFGMVENKTCTIIYVSTDTNPEEPKRVLASQPWLRMTFFDDSDFAPLVPMREGNHVTEMEEISRGEEFIQAGELEMGVEKITWGEEEYQHDYVRPLSRAAVTVLMRSFSTPSIAIYHIPTHQFLTRNVKLSAFQTGTIEANYRLWRNGGTPSLRIYDIIYAMRYSIVFLILGALYQLLITVGGDEYNVIPGWLDQLSWRSRQLFA